MDQKALTVSCKLKPWMYTFLFHFLPLLFLFLILYTAPGMKNTEAIQWLKEPAPREDSPSGLGIKVHSVPHEYNPHASYQRIEFVNPLDDSLFPPEMASPFFEWIDKSDYVKNWVIRIDLPSRQEPIHILCKEQNWTPPKAVWESIKMDSLDAAVQITVLGYINHPTPEVVSLGTIRIHTSPDPVGASILFRRVPPIFSYANSHPEVMEWCLADISSYENPRVIMSHQPYCASCHTFSRKGDVLGMDMDYRDDKGSYFITGVKEDVLLKEKDFISWNEFPRDDGLPGSGLFSRLSPDGRYVASTINDISFLAKISDPYCSQLFFPIQGDLAYYSRADRRISRFYTGERRRDVVDTDPSWSPDGRDILFSRALMTRDLYAELGGETIFSAVGTDIEKLNKQYPVHFNVYQVSFNSGKGDIAVPLKGASFNGNSNYFARYSPDGRWIVFTKSSTGMVLQPDSRLYILPSGGGEARLMTCNRSRMNSWHTWSPNSRWLAFVSKENMPYSELYLTHIDHDGNDSVPVLILRFNKPGYAINVPEFAGTKTGDIHSIQLQYDGH